MSITIQLSGGLGNQLFQYATARTICDRIGTELYLDARSFRFDIYNRRFEIDKFNIRFDGVIFPRKSDSPLKKSILLKRLIWKFQRDYWFRLFEKGKIINDISSNKLSNISKASGDFYLQGYFQSYRNFEINRKRIVKDIYSGNKIGKKNEKLLEEIRSDKNSVCVHVRLYNKDIHDNIATKILSTCSKEYFHKSIHFLMDKIEKPVFYLFSDQINSCKEYLLDEFNYKIVDYNKGESSYIDLLLMKECRHFIISNSTFGWWAAWLSESKEKIVIAPRQWFVSKKKTVNELIPVEWLEIDN